MVERVYCFIWVQILKTKIKKNKNKTKYNTQEQQWRRFHREMNSGGRRRSVGAEVWCEWLLNHVCQQETGLTRIKWQTEEDKGVNCETDKSGDARRESFHLKADRKYVTQIRYRHECRKNPLFHTNDWITVNMITGKRGMTLTGLIILRMLVICETLLLRCVCIRYCMYIFTHSEGRQKTVTLRGQHSIKSY